jgi:DNA-binding beta-propeller fold protein YncE
MRTEDCIQQGVCQMFLNQEWSREKVSAALAVVFCMQMMVLLGSQAGTDVSADGTSIHSNGYDYRPPNHMAYVAGTISQNLIPINVATNIAGAPISTEGFNPIDLAITPNGRTLYAVSTSPNFAVLAVDLRTGTITHSIPFPESNLIAIAMSPDGKTAYVTDLAQQRVIPIDLAVNTPGTPIELEAGAYDIAITPDGSKAYVTTLSGTDIFVINLITNAVQEVISIGEIARNVAITPDGTRAYVTLASFNIICIDISSSVISGPFSTGAGGGGPLAISPDGLTAFLVSGTDFISFNLTSNMVGPSITFGATLDDLAITSDGKTAYVVDNTNNTATPVDLVNLVPSEPIPAGNQPFAIAVTPD